MNNVATLNNTEILIKRTSDVRQNIHRQTYNSVIFQTSARYTPMYRIVKSI